jgi:hypothetical protein
MADIPLQVVVVAQNLRLRAQPSLDAFAPVILPRGTSAELLSLDPPGWAQLRVQSDGQPRVGWCMRRMLDEALHAPMPHFPSAEGRMWDLVQYYTGRVGYLLGAKAASLNGKPPVIDCSGWVALLLTSAMNAQNTDAGEDIFDPADIAACNAWSDRILLEIEARTPVLVEGHDIAADSLPRSATIGLNMGDFTWEKNAPRLRGINHIVQVVRRPADQAPFVTESRGPSGQGGVRLTPLADWLHGNARYIQAGKAWAVDPFAMADPFSEWVIRARTEAEKRDIQLSPHPGLPGSLTKPDGNGFKIVARWDGKTEHADEWTRCVLTALQEPSNLLLNIQPRDIAEFLSEISCGYAETGPVLGLSDILYCRV